MTIKTKQKPTVLRHSMSSQITLAEPPGSGLRRALAEWKRKEHENFLVPQVGGPITQTM